ncbi:uncharacterized protein TNCV_622761 [Trichonephila clavipes]|nr:uncharacterized protein TNCV_622761 [Trichonephila clavipes]
MTLAAQKNRSSRGAIYPPQMHQAIRHMTQAVRHDDATHKPSQSPDAIGITESGSSADNLRFFPLKGYINHSPFSSLGRSRQIAPGIVIFVKNGLSAEPLLKHAMTSSDSLEAIELRTLKEEKDLGRDRVDSSGFLKACISLRKKQAILKKEINAKCASFNKLLENFDYRKDDPKAFRLISALNGKRMQPSDLDIANIFLKFYHKLGDEKPSHLLRKIKELSNGQLQDDFLQSLWLQRMPPHIQTVLSASSEPLDKLAIIADKVSEVVGVLDYLCGHNCSSTIPVIFMQCSANHGLSRQAYPRAVSTSC